jgi:small subunit ribosomal protein S6
LVTDGEPAAIQALEAAIRLEERIMRFLTTRLTELSDAPSPLMRRKSVPAEETATEEKTDEAKDEVKAEETKVEEKAEAKTEEKAVEAKVEEKTETAASSEEASA